MAYYRRKKLPSPYRFLKPLYFSAVASMAAFLYKTQVGALCDIGKRFVPSFTCKNEMPDTLALTLLGFFVWGIVGALYRVYRDFYKGDYYADRL